MFDDTLAQGNSPIHRLDPRIRIITAGFLSIANALCDNLVIALGFLIIALILVRLANLSMDQAVKRVAPLFWFLVMIWIFLPLTFGGELLFHWNLVSISWPGILMSAKITLKSLAILLLFCALVATLPITSLGSGLHGLKVPDKLVFLLLMTFRYIFVIQEEYTRLLRAARFRGFKSGTNLHSYKTYAYLAGMLFVRASYRAQRVYQAMRCRGFHQKFYTLDLYPSSGLNWLFFGAVLVAATGLLLIETIWMK